MPSPRAVDYGRASDRLRLSRWLRTATDHILRVQYAKAVGNPDVVPDLTEAERLAIVEADSKDRNAAAKMVLDITLAAHARWEPPTPGDDTPRALGSDWRRPSIEELEERLAALADDGDRAAILAMLAALDPARYGPPGKVAPPPDTSVDTVDFIPAIVTKT
jgi:hypothetical protein